MFFDVRPTHLGGNANEIHINYTYLSWMRCADRQPVRRVTVRHHEACRVMPNSHTECQFFLSASHIHDRYVFLERRLVSRKNLFNFSTSDVFNILERSRCYQRLMFDSLRQRPDVAYANSFSVILTSSETLTSLNYAGVCAP